MGKHDSRPPFCCFNSIPPDGDDLPITSHRDVWKPWGLRPRQIEMTFQFPFLTSWRANSNASSPFSTKKQRMLTFDLLVSGGCRVLNTARKVFRRNAKTVRDRRTLLLVDRTSRLISSSFYRRAGDDPIGAAPRMFAVEMYAPLRGHLESAAGITKSASYASYRARHRKKLVAYYATAGPGAGSSVFTIHS